MKVRNLFITIGLIFFFGLISLFGENLRVATFNVQNYLVADRMAHGQWMKEYPKPEVEKDALRKIIKEVNPDILALQEMGSIPFLEELRADLKEEGMIYRYMHVMEGSDPDRHVALLSRKPFKQVLDYKDLSFKYMGKYEFVRRGLLEAVFESEGKLISLFVVHLKSKREGANGDTYSNKQRLGEAEAIRDKIRARYPIAGHGLFLIAGDFNDHPKSKPLKRFFKVGKRRIASPVLAEDSRGEVWTYHWGSRGEYSQIDYFLASDEMLDFIKDGRAHIVDAPASKVASDHRLLYLDLVL